MSFTSIRYVHSGAARKNTATTALSALCFLQRRAPVRKRSELIPREIFANDLVMLLWSAKHCLGRKKQNENAPSLRLKRRTYALTATDFSASLNASSACLSGPSGTFCRTGTRQKSHRAGITFFRKDFDTNHTRRNDQSFKQGLSFPFTA